MARYVCNCENLTLRAPGPRKGIVSVRFVRNPATRCITLREEQERLFAAALADAVTAGTLTPADVGP